MSLLRVALVALMTTLLWLQGCAGSGVSGASQDWVTASDEPEARKRARVRLELAAGYYQQGQTTVALDEVKQALLTDPRYAAAYNLRGLIYLQLNEPRLAEDSFQQALRIDPRDGDIWHNLGWMYCQQSRHPQATEAFQRALQTPNYAMAARTWMTQGVCQLRAGQWAEAERSLERSLALDAGNPVTLYHLAVLLHQRGEHQRARFFIRRVNNGDAASAESLWLGIKIENRLQNPDAASQLGTQLLRRFPASREAGAFERGAFDE